jgi:hypothetical protein
MRLFKKSPSNVFDFLNPDGSRPDTSSRETIAKAVRNLAITSQEYRLHPVDSDSEVRASSILEISGFRFHEGKASSHLAAARVIGRGLDEDKSEVEALAILTPDFLSIHWSHRLQKRAWKFVHSDILGVEVDGPLTAALHYGNSWRRTGTETLEVGDWTFEISLLPSADGHENRRSMTLWMTLANEIGKKFPGFAFINLE